VETSAAVAPVARHPSIEATARHPSALKVAHWQEMIAHPAMRIGRPHQLYTGPTRRDYVEIDGRGE
jgi:hypothetical protein